MEEHVLALERDLALGSATSKAPPAAQPRQLSSFGVAIAEDDVGGGDGGDRKRPRLAPQPAGPLVEVGRQEHFFSGLAPAQQAATASKSGALHAAFVDSGGGGGANGLVASGGAIVGTDQGAEGGANERSLSEQPFEGITVPGRGAAGGGGGSSSSHAGKARSFEVGSKVKYWSATHERWVRAVVKGVHLEASSVVAYDLDAKPMAPISRVRPDATPPDAPPPDDVITERAAKAKVKAKARAAVKASAVKDSAAKTSTGSGRNGDGVEGRGGAASTTSTAAKLPASGGDEDSAPFEVGDNVLYWSSTAKQWLEGVVKGARVRVSTGEQVYDLDCKVGALPSQLRFMARPTAAALAAGARAKAPAAASTAASPPPLRPAARPRGSATPSAPSGASGASGAPGPAPPGPASGRAGVGEASTEPTSTSAPPGKAPGPGAGAEDRGSAAASSSSSKSKAKAAAAAAVGKKARAPGGATAPAAALGPPAAPSLRTKVASVGKTRPAAAAATASASAKGTGASAPAAPAFRGLASSLKLAAAARRRKEAGAGTAGDGGGASAAKPSGAEAPSTADDSKGAGADEGPGTFAVGQKVRYWSSTVERWVKTVVRGVNFGPGPGDKSVLVSYNLNAKAQAETWRVRPFSTPARAPAPIEAAASAQPAAGVAPEAKPPPGDRSGFPWSRVADVKKDEAAGDEEEEEEGFAVGQAAEYFAKSVSGWIQVLVQARTEADGHKLYDLKGSELAVKGAGVDRLRRLAPAPGVPDGCLASSGELVTAAAAAATRRGSPLLDAGGVALSERAGGAPLPLGLRSGPCSAVIHSASAASADHVVSTARIGSFAEPGAVRGPAPTLPRPSRWRSPQRPALPLRRAAR